MRAQIYESNCVELLRFCSRRIVVFMHYQMALILSYITPPPPGVQNPQQNQKNDFFKMQPKIVVVLVLRITEHLEFGLILQKLPSTLHFYFWVHAQRKMAQNGPKKDFFQN